jgi:hypothetical protein
MGRWTKEYHLYNIDTETEIILSQDHHGKWAWDLEEQMNGEQYRRQPRPRLRHAQGGSESSSQILPA